MKHEKALSYRWHPYPGSTRPHMEQGVRTERARYNRRSSYRGIPGGRKAYFETGATESFEILERASARIECLRHAGEQNLLCRITTIAHLNKLRIREMPTAQAIPQLEAC